MLYLSGSCGLPSRSSSICWTLFGALSAMLCRLLRRSLGSSLPISSCCWTSFVCLMACSGSSISRSLRSACVLLCGSLFAVSGCSALSVDTSVQEPGPVVVEKVVTSPSAQTHPSLAAGPGTLASVEQYASLFGSGPVLAPLQFSGSRREACIALSRLAGLGYVLVDSGGERSSGAGPLGGGGADDRADSLPSEELAFDLPAGPLDVSLASLAASGFSAVRVGSVIYCGAAPGVWLFDVSGLADHVLAALGVPIDNRIGDLVVVTDQAVAASVSDSLSAVRPLAALHGSVHWLGLPPSADVQVLVDFLAGSYVAGQYWVSGGHLFGTESVVALARDFLASGPGGDCGLFYWPVPVGLEETLLGDVPTLFPDALCSGSWVLDASTGVLTARVRGSSRSELLEHLGRISSVGRPVVVSGAVYLLNEGQSTTLDLVLSSSDVADSWAIGASSVAWSAPIGGIGAVLDYSSSDSSGVSAYEFSIATLLGLSDGISSGRSVRYATGAVVDPSGAVRETTESQSLGIGFTAGASRVHGGHLVRYNVNITAPGGESGSFAEMSRAGSVFVPDGREVIGFHLVEGVDSRVASLLAGGTTADSRSRSLFVISVEPGLLSGGGANVLAPADLEFLR